MSAYTGLRRSCRAVMPMGGPCPPRERLLPENSVTRVCAISGDRDSHAPHENISELLGKYTPKDPSTDGVHIIKGLGHIIAEEHFELGLAFLRSCGCE